MNELLWDTINGLIQQGKRAAAVDMVYDYFDEALHKSQLDLIAKWMQSYDAAKIPPEIGLCALTATLGAKHLLSERALFLEVIRAQLGTEANENLRGLE